MPLHEATVLSGEIRGHVDPDALAALVGAAGGTLGSFVGRTMTAVWMGAGHRTAACAGALRLAGADLRAALDSGPVTMSHSFLGLGARGLTGETVKRAERMRSATKFFGVRLVASAAVLVDGRSKVPARSLGSLRFLGSPDAVPVSELLGPGSALSAGGEALARYEEAVAAFGRRDFAAAMTAFQDVLALAPGDAPSLLYAAVSQDYAATPPPDSWDGVFNLTS